MGVCISFCLLTGSVHICINLILESLSLKNDKIKLHDRVHNLLSDHSKAHLLPAISYFIVVGESMYPKVITGLAWPELWKQTYIIEFQTPRDDPVWRHLPELYSHWSSMRWRGGRSNQLTGSDNNLAFFIFHECSNFVFDEFQPFESWAVGEYIQRVVCKRASWL